MIENEGTIYQNVWETYIAKAVLKGKFIAINTYIKKQSQQQNQQPNFTT